MVQLILDRDSAERTLLLRQKGSWRACEALIEPFALYNKEM